MTNKIPSRKLIILITLFSVLFCNFTEALPQSKPIDKSKQLAKKEKIIIYNSLGKIHDKILLQEKENKKKDRDRVAIVAFGIAGMIIGACVGGRKKSEYPWGGSEWAFETKKILIGAGIGLAIGVTVGYILSKSGIGKGKTTEKRK